MRVVIDHDLCEANGLCVIAAPEVFDLDGDDTLHLRAEHPPEELREKVQLAVDRCPMQALSLED